jgi:hypothetical protein
VAILGIFRLRNVVALALVGIFAAAGYGFAAGNTVQERGAGDGQAAISGYQTGSISYTLNATNPANIDSVSFTLTPLAGAATPTSVKVRLVSSSGSWYNCTAPVSPSTTWSCATSGVTAAAANELRVVAAQ